MASTGRLTPHGGSIPPSSTTDRRGLDMSVEDDYLKLRKVQKRARGEIQHIMSHHPDLWCEWKEDVDTCFRELRELVEWEPED